MLVRRFAIYTLSGIFILSIFFILAYSPSVIAAPNLQKETPIPLLSISDDTCLECHGKPGPTYQLQNGDTLDLYINPNDHANSVHGKLGYACVQCHRDVGNYPHPPFIAKDRRDVSIQLNQTCQYCHSSQNELTKDSVHARALENGNSNAAICVDCHTAHTVKRLIDPQTQELLPEARLWIPQTCAKCHNEIYQKYQESVHGSALIGNGNPDVPTCIDCHGVHNIEDPTTAQFRLNSPQICAKCHTDPEIMDKYGISTQVLNTYVADFHGTSILLFEPKTPDAQENKPVCYDCHGVHDIKAVDDPEKGLQVKENILIRCQVCHPDANTNFPSAWLSHYIPSPTVYPVVYYINLFYKFFIPTVVGGMAVLVTLDFTTARRKKRKASKSTGLETAEVKPPTEESTVEETIVEEITVEEPTLEVTPTEETALDESNNYNERIKDISESQELSQDTDLESDYGNEEVPDGE